MKNSLFGLFAAALLSLFLFACGDAGKTPESVAKAYLESFNGSDLAKAASYVEPAFFAAPDGKKTFEQLFKALSEGQSKKGGITKMEVLDKRLTDKQARVALDCFYGDGTKVVNVIEATLIDDQWYIHIR